MRLAASILISISAFCLALGITQPLLVFERLFFLQDKPSLYDIVAGLVAAGDVLLAIIVALFSIIFPIAKIVLLQIIATGPEEDAPAPFQRWLSTLSKWSMMDVLLVALAVFAAKTSGLATALSQPGLWFYATSALAGAIASRLLSKGDH